MGRDWLDVATWIETGMVINGVCLRIERDGLVRKLTAYSSCIDIVVVEQQKSKLYPRRVVTTSRRDDGRFTRTIGIDDTPLNIQ